MAAEIDWSKPCDALDKELNIIDRGNRVGNRLADKIFKVYLRGRPENWVIIHFEVQGRKEREFSKRMLIYHYRLRDRYRLPVISIAILVDNNKQWKPTSFKENIFKCCVGMRFILFKYWIRI